MATSAASAFTAAKAIVDEKVESRVDDGQEMIDGDQYVAPLQRIDTPCHYSWTLESIWLARQSIKIQIRYMIMQKYKKSWVHIRIKSFQKYYMTLTGTKKKLLHA